ncbi:MAG TPA: RNA polymerase sigma factor [Vicinamibacterales bacterium]|nr:RNA polymerase sigma factor [Vicinamibacterales bacterium]
MTDAEFQAAFEQHKDAVYRFAWRMSGSAAAAEDITQDVFVGLLRHPDRFDPGRGTLRALLLGIARNLALKRWRKEHRLEPLDEEAMAAEPVDLGRGEVGDMVGRAVGALGPLQREVVILAEYEGLTLAEIARAVDADVGTVKSRLHRARENLRRTLAPLRSGQPTTT